MILTTNISIESSLLKVISKIAEDENTTQNEMINHILKQGLKQEIKNEELLLKEIEEVQEEIKK
jgi:hypothetical protein